MVMPCAVSAQRSEGLNTRPLKRSLLVAVLTVGITLASPAQATSPKFVMNNAWAKKHAQEQLKYYGWKQRAEWKCLETLWHRESGWRLEARNKTPVKVKKNGKWIKVHAGGIPQILGMSPKEPATVQVHRGLVYIKSRYGSPCKALQWWNINRWY